MQGNPNKYIRKAFFDVLNNITVSGNIIPCFDERIMGSVVPKYYILLSTQNKRQDKYTKCADRWNVDILIDIVTTYPATGNTGSKLLADDIEEQVINLEETIILSGGYKINQRELVSSDSLVTIGTTTNVFRQLIRFNYFLTN